MASNRTRNQARILHTLQSLNREIAAQELYALLQDIGPRIGLATVYRSLEALKQQGELQVRTLDSGISLYSSLQRDCHHFNCVRCGKSEVIDPCPLQGLDRQLPATNFKVFYHTLEFYGLCLACQGEGEAHGMNEESASASACTLETSPTASSSTNCC